jgi:hypothetical protein
MNTIVAYQANNSVNIYDYHAIDPEPQYWHWVKNFYDNVLTVVSTTDIVAKWIIRLK